MHYHSTNNPDHRVDLKEAILRSLPPDNGLYMPDTLRRLGRDFWRIWRDLSFHEIGLAVAGAFFGEGVPEDALAEINPLPHELRPNAFFADFPPEANSYQPPLKATASERQTRNSAPRTSYIRAPLSS